MIEERNKQPEDQPHRHRSGAQQSFLLERQTAQKILKLLEALSQISPLSKIESRLSS